ncbi:MAG: hypothetical protein EHM64_16745 [Ignavibacteriae bacterium]|nr:MAG: hypothetical protein EHM64_16745 [Ignavibacteriota bacterium]
MKKNTVPIIRFIGVCVLLTYVSCKNPTTGPQESIGPVPPTFYLAQNYPNPFKDTTSIEYGIPSSGGSQSTVTIIVYDLFKNELRTLVKNSSHPAGTFNTKWDGMDSRGIIVPSGLYIIEMKGYTPQSTIIHITTIKE